MHTCAAGLHTWLDAVSAERCCTRGWYRAMRYIDDCDDLDDLGRTYAYPSVYGWVRLPEEVPA